MVNVNFLMVREYYQEVKRWFYENFIFDRATCTIIAREFADQYCGFSWQGQQPDCTSAYNQAVDMCRTT